MNGGLLDFSAPADSDCAVALTCDAAYLPWALHLARQIVLASPARDFDVLIVSAQPLALPDWAAQAGIRNLVSDALENGPNLPTRWLPNSTYLRLYLARDLANRYRRILYLDCDMFFEGGDLSRLLRIDLGRHPLAAVQDVMCMVIPNHHGVELRAIGAPPSRTMNAGLLLIDTAAWNADRVLERCLDLGTTKPEIFVKHDQALLNGVFQGAFAELSPVWNWQLNQRFPLLSRRFPARIRHFIGPDKPWKDPAGKLEARIRLAYAEFVRAIMPEAPLVQGPVPPLVPLDVLARHVLDQYRMRKQLEGQLARFRNEWDVKL
jgi:hypothetical protein